MCNFYPVSPRCFLSASELRWSLQWTLHSKALQVPHPTRLQRWELGFFIWMLKYLCHLYPKDPCEYHRSCCEGEAISPNKCCDFCCPTFLNSQAKGAPPAPSAPPVVCDLALQRCPWFSGDSATFFRRFHRFQLHWLGHSKRRRHGWMRTWHAWLGSQEKDCYVHCYMVYNKIYTISQKQQEKRC